MKQTRPFIYIVFLFLFLLSPLSANESDNNSLEKDQSLHLYEDIDLISTLKFDYGKPKIIIKSVYPQLISDSDPENIQDFNALVLKMVNEEVAKFKGKVKEKASIQNQLPRARVTNNLFIDYAASYMKVKRNHIISIRFSIQGFITGFGRPYHYNRVLNYNLDSNQSIQLSELFLPEIDPLTSLSEYTSQSLYRTLHNHSLITRGTTPYPSNFENWNIKSNGLLITFGEDAVAPYALGTQTVLVPYSALETILSPDAPITDCVQHTRRCANNNILTGGFIDEV